jgi:hypothetical protein
MQHEEDGGRDFDERIPRADRGQAFAATGMLSIARSA